VCLLSSLHARSRTSPSDALSDHTAPPDAHTHGAGVALAPFASTCVRVAVLDMATSLRECADVVVWCVWYIVIVRATCFCSDDRLAAACCRATTVSVKCVSTPLHMLACKYTIRTHHAQIRPLGVGSRRAAALRQRARRARAALCASEEGVWSR
jgi:hypothetical protein